MCLICQLITTFFQILQGELPEAQKKLETALRFGETACSKAEDLEKEELEEEVALLQEEYDNYTEALAQMKLSLEVGNLTDDLTNLWNSYSSSIFAGRNS